MNKQKLLSITMTLLLGVSSIFAQKQPVDYVNPLMGTDSKISLSNGNTYPAIALPWGMNFWMPQTGKMGDGWAYTYASDKIRGFKQTHQPSPWINDYGQFSIMPMTKQLKIDQDSRASWFSHKAEKATPYYYSVYLSEYNMTTEIAPTERCAYFRFTFPEASDAYVVVDAFDRGSYVKVIPEENKIVGYTTRNSGGVPQNFRNYFVIEFDKPFTFNKVWADYHLVETHLELQSNHVGAAIGFSTKTCFPSDMASMEIGKCEKSGTLTRTASIWLPILSNMVRKSWKRGTFGNCLRIGRVWGAPMSTSQKATIFASPVL